MSNPYAIPVNYQIAEQVLPKAMVKIMRYFDVKIFDLQKWDQTYEPSISSLFLCDYQGNQGTSYFEDTKYGIVTIYNGTLAVVGSWDLNKCSRRYYTAITSGLPLNNTEPPANLLINMLMVKFCDFTDDMYQIIYDQNIKRIPDKKAEKLISDMNLRIQKYISSNVIKDVLSANKIFVVIVTLLEYALALNTEGLTTWVDLSPEHVIAVLRKLYGPEVELVIDEFEVQRNQKYPSKYANLISENDIVYIINYCAPKKGMGYVLTSDMTQDLPLLVTLLITSKFF